MNTPRFPNIRVKLINRDGNAFSIIGRVTKTMRRSGVSEEEIGLFREEAMSGSYDTLLKTVMKWVDVF
jgi:hypothetical protein